MGSGVGIIPGVTVGTDYLTKLGNDYLYLDGIETATYTPGTGTAVATAKVFRTEQTYRELAVGAVLGIRPTDVVLEVWAVTIPLITPAEGDTITVGAEVWRVLAIRRIGVGSTKHVWRCTCRLNL